jgi:hypothetical protein
LTLTNRTDSPEEHTVTDSLGYAETMGDAPTGARVELSPATDAWMMGDRFGTVTAHGRKYISVRMDRSGRTRKLTPTLLRPLAPAYQD